MKTLRNHYSMPFDCRVKESAHLLQKYPDRIPVICERLYSDRNHLPPLQKNKFLVPPTITVGQFMYIIRKRMTLSPEKGLFLYVNRDIPAQQMTFHELYEQKRAEDGFLYIDYTSENTFG